MKYSFGKIVLSIFIFCISIVAFVLVVNLCEGASNSHVNILLENEMLDVADKNDKYLEFKKNMLEDRLHNLFLDEELTLKLRVNANTQIVGVELTLDRSEKLDETFDHQLKKYIADYIGLPIENVAVMKSTNEIS